MPDQPAPPPPGVATESDRALGRRPRIVTVEIEIRESSFPPLGALCSCRDYPDHRETIHLRLLSTAAPFDRRRAISGRVKVGLDSYADTWLYSGVQRYLAEVVAPPKDAEEAGEHLWAEFALVPDPEGSVYVEDVREAERQAAAEAAEEESDIPWK